MRSPPFAALAALALAPVFAFTGCRGHVFLDELPEPHAPLEERALAYEKLRPQVLRDPAMAPAGMVLPRSLVLNDGTVVEDPNDLAPALKPNAPTARYAADAQRGSDLATWLYVAGVGFGVLGIAGEIGGGMYAVANTPPGGAGQLTPQSEAGIAIMLGSVGVGLVGALATVIPATLIDAEADRARDIAFQSYDRDLRARLALVPKTEVLVAQWQDANAPPPVEAAP